MTNAIVIESLDPPVMDVIDCIRCGAACDNGTSLEWRITVNSKPTCVRLRFCTPCAIAYLAADVAQTQEIEREIGTRLERITADLTTAAISGPTVGGMQ